MRAEPGVAAPPALKETRSRRDQEETPSPEVAVGDEVLARGGRSREGRGEEAGEDRRGRCERSHGWKLSLGSRNVGSPERLSMVMRNGKTAASAENVTYEPGPAGSTPAVA